MRVLAVAGDAGGARALTPVIHALQKLPAVEVTCRAYAAAFDVWERARLAPAPVGDPGDAAVYDRLLVGTSLGGEPWELRYVEAATTRGIRSVAVLDSWIHYRERFVAPDGRLVLPTAIAVMDDAAENAMRALDFPPSRLFVTGQPVLAGLGHYRDEKLREEIRALVRARLGLREERLVLFVSQPLSELWTRERLGFLEEDALADVAHVLAEMATGGHPPLALVVKRHPREAGRPFEGPDLSGAGVRVLVDPEALHDLPPVEWAVGSDATLGMNSMLLMEAAAAGTPVVSYQPHLRVADPLPSNATGLTRGVTDPRDLASAIADALKSGPGEQAAPTFPPDAAERIVHLVMQEKEDPL